MTLKFKDELVEKANEIIELANTDDKKETLSYILEIYNIISNYKKTGLYNSIYASELDRNIRSKYPLCSTIDNYVPRDNIDYTRKTSTLASFPEELRRLDVDRFGIFYTELLKEGFVKQIEDFID